jgi:hypothetical protein
MYQAEKNPASELFRLTNLAVRSYWLDGLWDLASVIIFLVLGVWGAYYVRFVAFHSSTWPIFQDFGRHVVWVGLLILIIALLPIIWAVWVIVKHLKLEYISPYTGYAEHRFFMPVDRKVFVWYFIYYAIGLGLLYGLFTWLKGGPYMMSVPFIISPAAMFWAIGRIYGLRRYQWIAIFGLIMAVSLELLLTTNADYMIGPRNLLDVIPAWGCPTLPCLIWGIMSGVSGLIGLISVRRMKYGAK